MIHMRIASRVLALAALAAGGASCGDVARTGQSPMYLTINSLTGSSGRGGAAAAGSNVLLSDVIVNVTAPAPCAPASPCPTVFNDLGAATFSVAPKDVTDPTAPTSNNSVTLTRYRVSYRRTDGRNTPGVDVPYAFEGAITITVPLTNSATFELVRHAAKNESPLVQLRNSPSTITTIADVTFYGTDRVGNDISATGSIQIDFGNFGD